MMLLHSFEVTGYFQPPSQKDCACTQPPLMPLPQTAALMMQMLSVQRSIQTAPSMVVSVLGRLQSLNWVLPQEPCAAGAGAQSHSKVRRLSFGAQHHSALEAERSALFWALAWALAHADGRTRVWTDSLAVVGQTSGQWGGSASSLLAKSCRALAHAVEASRDVCFSAFRHVRAHKGDPFNELVDVLAKGHWIADTHIPAPYCSLHAWVHDGSIEWMWLLCEATRNPGQWPAPTRQCPHRYLSCIRESSVRPSTSTWPPATAPRDNRGLPSEIDSGT